MTEPKKRPAPKPAPKKDPRGPSLRLSSVRFLERQVAAGLKGRTGFTERDLRDLKMEIDWFPEAQCVEIRPKDARPVILPFSALKFAFV